MNLLFLLDKGAKVVKAAQAVKESAPQQGAVDLMNWMLYSVYGLVGISTISALLLATIAMKMRYLYNQQQEILEELKKKS